MDMCFTCHTAKLSNEEQSLRDDEVLAALRNRHKSMNVTWPDKGTKTLLPNGIETDSVVTIMGEDMMKYCPDLPSSFLKCRKTIAFFEKKTTLPRVGAAPTEIHSGTGKQTEGRESSS